MVSDRELMRAIADNFCYSDVERPDPLPEPWETIWFRTDEALHVTSSRAQAVHHACKGLPHERALARAILRAMPSDLEYESLEQLARNLQPVSWLWPGWIPRGMLTLLGASPGAGKSLVALDLCRRVIHGEAWPDGQAMGVGGRACIYVDAEAVPQVLNDRASAWGMDRSRLFLMLPPVTYGMIDLGDEEQQDRLVDMCAALEPELVVVDSLSAISVRGENNVEDVRGLLGYLTNVAREFACGLLLIHHLRKRGAVELADVVGPDDFRGSGHIMAMARSVMALSVVRGDEEEGRNGPRRLEVIKTNLARHPKALGLALTPCPSADGRGEFFGAPALRYGKAPTARRERSQVDECGDWLVDLLEAHDGQMRPREVLALAREAGFHERMVYRARRAMDGRIQDSAGKHDPDNLWMACIDEDEL